MRDLCRPSYYNRNQEEERVEIPVPHFPIRLPVTLSTRHPIPAQETGNAVVIPLGSRVCLSGGDYLLSGGSHARLLLENAIYKNKKKIR
ncbi:hypothetical protein EVAR_20774_1 [Eumeta japonica]|uniref:Uncharacterized protein n=1 Tax=Eumeta variegata TaxID=151549 RepID=A0A4C1UE93_EUMVA|nr:hypothetical protein EVAR_20774_1 [Eumeta japonica]